MQLPREVFPQVSAQKLDSCGLKGIGEALESFCMVSRRSQDQESLNGHFRRA